MIRQILADAACDVLEHLGEDVVIDGHCIRALPVEGGGLSSSLSVQVSAIGSQVKILAADARRLAVMEGMDVDFRKSQRTILNISDPDNYGWVTLELR